MQGAELLKYMENPSLLEARHVQELQKLVHDFPYFQSAHILLSLASKKWDASVYQQSLRKTAIVVTNRSRLFELVHKNAAPTEEPARTQESAVIRVELQSTEVKPVTVGEDVIQNQTDPDKLVADTQNLEETRQEIDILKAAELSSLSQEFAEKNKEEELNRQVEVEMGKQLVVSYLEKEVLKTTELHDPQKKLETPVTFSDWLVYLKNKNAITPPEENSAAKKPVISVTTESRTDEETRTNDPGQVRKQKNRALIDRIIESNPGHIRVKEEQKFFVPDTRAKESLQENEHLVTETLAQIYALQGNISKAVRAYEILSLKFPQKSAYFAGLIKKLKESK